MRARWLARALYPRLRRLAERRAPDFVIGGAADPYMRRWWVIPRNPLFNVYLHNVLRSDDDRALHDHPWVNLSLILAGGYAEVTPPGGLSPLQAAQLELADRRVLLPGALRWRGPRSAHRLELIPNICWPGTDHDVRATPAVWTLFITGPRLRAWGFWCPKGWVHWRTFTAGERGETVGRGCE